ncbi:MULTISPECIES: hypothetical protein [unclassified Natrinema]|uniref:hypothetical protein n=1 Tax=unclassified Natrinema TaxID=2622230 RepID=UPI00026D44C4|nr:MULTISPECIES: hypothetical protein [unclassified Natrinema]AFO58999.1 hypothetical protein NJ7G_3782 [Natrinema sp. J7-2]
MTTTRSVALLAAVVVGLTVAPLASAAAVDSLTEDHALHSARSETAPTNASVGTLLQATAAETKETVETGMFEAAYETADDESQAAIVGDRTAELESKLRSLEAERAELREQRAGLSRGAYRSRMAKLTVEIATLERSIERTTETIDDGSIDDSDLATLRENATRLRENASAEAGPDIAAVARGLSDSDGPPGVGAGPPDDRGPSADTGGSSGDRTPGNGSGAGPPTEAGAGEGTETGSPHGDDVPGKSGNTGGGSENGESNGDGTPNRAAEDNGSGPGNAAPGSNGDDDGNAALGSNGDDNGNDGTNGDGAGSQASDPVGTDTESGNGHAGGNDDEGSTGPSSAGSGSQGGDRTTDPGGGMGGGAGGGTDTGRGSR